MWRVVAFLSLCLSANALLVSPAVRPKPIFAQRTDTPILGENSQTRGFRSVDNLVISRAVRLSNHAAALTSLAYFGLVSSTMQLPKMPMAATLTSVITRRVGPTTNAAFAQYFSTLVTPASYVFLIWPFIAATQAITLAVSILRPGFKDDAGPQTAAEAANSLGRGDPLAQSDLAALSLANAAATAWLFTSSNALPGALPLASVLILPFVPLFAAYPLRNPQPTTNKFYDFVFQVFSSFTTIASSLALTVELQHGGRIPLLASRPEVCGLVFLGCLARLISLPNRSLPRRAVTTLALSGVLARRLASVGVGGLAGLVLSPTFVGAAGLFGWSLAKLFQVDPDRFKVNSRVKELLEKRGVSVEKKD